MSRCWIMIIAVVTLSTLQPAVRADDAPAAEAAVQPVDRDSESLNVDDSSAVTTSIAKIGINLRNAGRGLSDGNTDEQTQTAQRSAMEELDKLIEAAKTAKPSNSSPRDDQSGTSQSRNLSKRPSGDPSEGVGTSESPQGGTSAQSSENRGGKADESSEDAAAARGSDDPFGGFRASIVRDAWGHLPPRLRDQLLNAGSEKYLPKYDSLVRDYFESLARPPASADPKSP
jgi:hypothetical protein